jgi:hypothetical protein
MMGRLDGGHGAKQDAVDPIVHEFLFVFLQLSLNRFNCCSTRSEM